MLKKIMVYTLSALILLSFIGCGKKEQSVEVPPRLLVLGDSIACYKNAFPGVLEEKYKAELEGICKHETHNRSVGGIGTLTLLSNLKSGTYDNDLEQADAVVVVIGGNNFCPALAIALDQVGVKVESGVITTKRTDLSAVKAELDAAGVEVDEVLVKIETDLLEIVTLLKQKTNGKIYFLTYFDFVSELPGSDIISNYTSNYFEKFNDIFVRHATGNYEVIDIAPAFQGRIPELTGMVDKGDNHPNDLGSQVIAEEIDKTFRKDGFTYKP